MKKLTGKSSPEPGQSYSAATPSLMLLAVFIFLDNSSKQIASQFSDVPFGIPGPSSGGRGGASAEGGGRAALEEEEQLIRTGQLTPFGTSVVGSSVASVTAESSSVGSGKKSRIPKKSGATSEPNQHNSDPAVLQSHPSSLESSLENGFGPDDWVPSLADFLESSSAASSSESEYFTDDELGRTKKKKKRLRDLSSDGLSDEEERAKSRKKGKGRKGKGKKVGTQRRYNDDGDEELYLERLR